IEKAHYEVFNILLQIMEDGVVTDSHGRHVDLKNCIIILTSNLGSQHLAALEDGQDVKEVEPQVMEIVRGAEAYFHGIFPPVGAIPGTWPGTAEHPHVYMSDWFAGRLTISSLP
ncbi:MAG: AAA domain-containing protein, partial [Desulfobulbaceae bacterium]|nr:AAA domain-containing protein [Desulfobulbaceae bacterium]